MSSGLCENCHKRPKFGTHKFCGKTCAAQAAAKPVRSKQSQPQGKTGPKNAGHQKGGPIPQKAVQLCIYCGQKPKFNNFDYCGKSCAALAGTTQTKPPAKQGVPAVKQKTTRPSNAPPSNAPASSTTKAHKARQAKVTVPQVEAEEDEEDEEDEEGDGDGGVYTDLDAYPSDSVSESEDEPSVPATAAPQPGATRGGKPGGGVSQKAPGICAVPGCTQPSHVDRHGVKTKYCSTKHREEAVNLGLEDACIMCQRYPQSTSDYFCSSACRNQSMTKT